MFVIRFVTGSVLGMIAGVVGGILTLAIILGVVILVLAAVGGPSPCTPGGGEIVVSSANADAFEQKWEAFDDALDAGSPSSVVFNESEVTSRADRFISDEGGDIDNIRICLHDGFGEMTGSVSAILGIDAEFRAKGNVDLSGGHPAVQFDDIDIGNVPGFLVEPFESLLEDAVEELLDKVNLEHSYTHTITEGTVRIDGQP